MRDILKAVDDYWKNIVKSKSEKEVEKEMIKLLCGTAGGGGRLQKDCHVEKSHKAFLYFP